MAASEAALCAFSSRKLSRIASTEPARVDTVVSRRTKRLVDALREIQRRFGAVAGRRRYPEAIAEFVAALIEIHEPEHRFAQQLTGQLQRRAARVRA